MVSGRFDDRWRPRSFGEGYDGIYSCVPASKIAAFIARHGGIKEEQA